MNIVTNWRIILKFILKKQSMNVWNGFIWLEGSYDCDNEFSGFIKGSVNFLNSSTNIRFWTHLPIFNFIYKCISDNGHAPCKCSARKQSQTFRKSFTSMCSFIFQTFWTRNRGHVTIGYEMGLSLTTTWMKWGRKKSLPLTGIEPWACTS